MGLDRRILPVLLGNILEAYDFFLYGLLAVYFSKIFFPESSNSLFFSFVLFSIAYIARPLGSILWGHIADNYGRKPVLLGTMSLMAIPALGMAVIPPYESIGIIASILVVILRFLQGVAFGGESPTVMVTIYELAPTNKKAFFTSFIHPSSFLGYLIGIFIILILNTFLSEEAMQSFGWRIMFGLSLIFIALLSYMRLNLVETHATKNQYHASISQIIKHDAVAILKVFLYLSCSATLLYNLLFHNYLIIWASDFGIQALVLQACIVSFICLFMPCVGYVSDKINKLKLLKITYICVIPIAPILYMLFITKDLFYMTIGYIIFAVLTCFAAAFSPAIIVPQASKKCRVSTVGLGVSFSVIFGSFIPAINELLKKTTHIDTSPAYLISACALISLITLYLLKNKEEI